MIEKSQITFKRSPNQSARKSKTIDTIIIHATAGSFDGSVSWMLNPLSNASAHYCISKTGEIVQLVDEKYKAWHAGDSSWNGKRDLNQNSIGIELENKNDGKDPYPEEQINCLVDLVKWIKMRHKIKDVLGHNQIAPKRKTDPGPMFPWDKFREAIK